jgi:cytoskeletal protein CcmA (bactofilin family)
MSIVEVTNDESKIINRKLQGMALFGDEDASVTDQSNLSSPGQVNMIGQGTVVEGTLHAESDIRVSGRVEGTLRVDGKAMIAQEGMIDGELTAANADVAGSIQGEVQVGESLLLKSSARIDGNIETERLVVEEGALFTGECRMGEDAATDEAPDGNASADVNEPDEVIGDEADDVSNGTATPLEDQSET